MALNTKRTFSKVCAGMCLAHVKLCCIAMLASVMQTGAACALLQALVNLAGIGADNCIDLFPFQESHECRHGGDLVFLRQVFALIDVDLQECDARMLL